MIVLTVTVFSITSAMNMSFFAFAVMAIAVWSFHDTSGALGVMVAVVTGLSGVEQVAEDEEHGAGEEWEGLHGVVGLRKVEKSLNHENKFLAIAKH